jgi:hypothetical protein
MDVERIYRYLDKLQNTQKGLVQQISYNHTLQTLGGLIQMECKKRSKVSLE